MKIKKTLSFIMIGITCLALLAGCKKPEEDTTQSPAETPYETAIISSDDDPTETEGSSESETGGDACGPLHNIEGDWDQPTADQFLNSTEGPCRVSIQVNLPENFKYINQNGVYIILQSKPDANNHMNVYRCDAIYDNNYLSNTQVQPDTYTITMVGLYGDYEHKYHFSYPDWAEEFVIDEAGARIEIDLDPEEYAEAEKEIAEVEAKLIH